MDESPIVRISPVATRSSHKAVALIDHARGVYGCDIQPGVWHTIFALASDTVVFEAKPGPYDAAVDKGFAPWSPAEGSPEAAVFLADLEDRFRRLSGLPARPW